MSDAPQESPHGSFWLSVLGITGCFLIFVVILYVAYLPSRGRTDPQPFALSAEEQTELARLPANEREARLAEIRWERQVPTAADRTARFTELRVKAAQTLTSYSWIDRDNGVVRLPIDRAIELTVQDLQRPRAGN